MNKNRQIISELQSFFKYNDASKAINYEDSGLGKLFSHTSMKSILGLKAMFLCYTDGKTQFMLDSTIQAETGKNEDRPQGLTKKQKAAQYTKERAEDEKVNTRKAEMTESKIANAIKMIRRAIVEGIRFDYLLVDSWFPCAELLQFIHSRHFKCNLIGMIKKLVKFKAVRYARSIGYHYVSIKASYAGMDVMLLIRASMPKKPSNFTPEDGLLRWLIRR